MSICESKLKCKLLFWVFCVCVSTNCACHNAPFLLIIHIECRFIFSNNRPGTNQMLKLAKLLKFMLNIEVDVTSPTLRMNMSDGMAQHTHNRIYSNINVLERPQIIHLWLCQSNSKMIYCIWFLRTMRNIEHWSSWVLVAHHIQLYQMCFSSMWIHCSFRSIDRFLSLCSARIASLINFNFNICRICQLGRIHFVRARTHTQICPAKLCGLTKTLVAMSWSDLIGNLLALDMFRLYLRHFYSQTT